MILLVTAYNGMWNRGEGMGIDSVTHMVTPRVTPRVTANTSNKLACALPPVASLLVFTAVVRLVRVIRQQLAEHASGGQQGIARNNRIV